MRALFLIDCWEQKWIDDTSPLGTNKFYDRMIEYLKDKTYDFIFFYDHNNDGYRTHSILKERFPNYIHLDQPDRKEGELPQHDLLERMSRYLNKGDSILIGGNGFNNCLCDGPYSFYTFFDIEYLKIFSCPEVVDSYITTEEKITKDHFLNHKRINWQETNNYFEMIGYDE